MGMSDLPEIYTRARGRSPSASVYISGKSQVPMLQLIYSTWVTHLQVYIFLKFIIININNNLLQLQTTITTT